MDSLFRKCDCCGEEFPVDAGEDVFLCDQECQSAMCEECNTAWQRLGGDGLSCPFCAEGPADRIQLAAIRKLRIPRFVVYDPATDCILTETPLPYQEAKAVADELDDVLIVRWTA